MPPTKLARYSLAILKGVPANRSVRGNRPERIALHVCVRVIFAGCTIQSSTVLP